MILDVYDDNCLSAGHSIMQNKNPVLVSMLGSRSFSTMFMCSVIPDIIEVSSYVDCANHPALVKLRSRGVFP